MSAGRGQRRRRQSRRPGGASWSHGPDRERGAVTVEFAVALPVLVLVVGLAAALVGGAAAQVRLQTASAAAARALGRGDSGAVQRVLAQGAPGATSSTVERGDVVCLTARTTVAVVGIARMPVSATSCAAIGGR